MSDRWTVRECPEHGIFSSVAVFTMDRCSCGRPFGEPFEVMRTVPLDADHDGLVSRNHGATARNAALAVGPRSGTQRAKVFQHITTYGFQGRTRDEIAADLGMSPNAVRPRVKELLDGRHIVVRDGTRPSAMGSEAEVLVARAYFETSEG